VWDGSGDNPYFAFLALADAIVATEDSVNMVTRGGRYGQAGLHPGAQRQVAPARPLPCADAGARRDSPFEGRLETWTYAPINDTELVASAIRRALHLETKA
jgi:uncharacterized protein